MFFHNFKYNLLIILREKAVIFWNIFFPIILAIFFNMAFSQLKDTKFAPINIAIIENPEYYASNLESFLKVVSTGEDRIFNIQVVNEKTAKEMLITKEISSYVDFKESIKVTVSDNSNNINTTIVKNFFNEVIQYQGVINDLNQNNVSNEIMNKIINNLTSNETYYQSKIPKNLNFITIQFYTIIAMIAIMGGSIGVTFVCQSQANLSKKGMRISIAPVKKKIQLLSGLLASFFIQIINVTILLLFLSIVLKVNFGTNIFLIYVLAIVGCLTGLAIGMIVAACFKKSEETKIGIMTMVSMIGSFFAGMMGSSIKYLIDSKIPIINKLNPVSLITDGYYSLYYYDELTRYWENIIILLIMTIVFLIISVIFLRRKRYDSI